MTTMKAKKNSSSEASLETSVEKNASASLSRQCSCSVIMLRQQIATFHQMHKTLKATLRTFRVIGTGTTQCLDASRNVSVFKIGYTFISSCLHEVTRCECFSEFSGWDSSVVLLYSLAATVSLSSLVCSLQRSSQLR